MKASIQDRLDQVPRSPGVYLMKDRQGTILYVGKAKDLRSRVRAYFTPSAKHPPKTEVMLSKVHDLDFIVTASEVEAYILESNLIKKNRPRYNVLLRDDKHYPYLRLSLQEEFPRLDVVRKIRKDGAKYFGPYVPGSHLRPTLDLIEKTFLLRKCKSKTGWKNGRPCLNAQIGRCLSACSGTVSKTQYDQIVRQVILFLQGKNRQLLGELSMKMEKASQKLDYETAAKIRDQILRIERVTEKQKMISTSLEDKDVFGVTQKGNAACVEILFVRCGKLLGKKDVFIDPLDEEGAGEFLQTALMQYYDKDRLIPPAIFVPFSVTEPKLVEKVLSKIREGKVQVTVPHRGTNLQLVRMAEENAKLALETYLKRKDRDRILLNDLQKVADLKKLPTRIEAFDISNIQGEYPVASMVVFENAKPLKSHYRHYRIQSVQGANDYAMMEEVLTRRYRSQENGDLPLPDLILMDGGKGQLNILLQVVRDKTFLEESEFMALAKARPNEPGDKHVDRFFLPERKEPVVLDPTDPVIHLLQRIRDESHRFAVNYYRTLHERETLSSRLLSIPGVGKKRTLNLLRHFGSLEGVRQASLEELTHIPNVTREVASRIFNTLHGEKSRLK